MTKITLVRTRSGFRNVPDDFFIAEPDKQIDEKNQALEVYTLPDGYEVARSQMDTLEIYDSEGCPCPLVMSAARRPKIVAIAGGIELKRTNHPNRSVKH